MYRHINHFKMIYLKTEDEIELLRAANLLVGKTLGEVAKLIKPGVTTKELDKVAEEFIRDHGAVPTFKGFPNQQGDPFPASLCTSVNDQIVHGIPGDVVLRDGDIVSIDCGTYMNGFCGDSAYTFCVGEVDESVRKLLKTTKEALYLGIENAVQGKRIGDIGYAVQQHCEANSYGVVRDFVGHGVGKEMHEDPQVPNYGKRGYGTMLKKGMCIAIEPMITLGSRQIHIERDGWTVRTKDGKCAAHFEHTVAVGVAKADILSSFAFIEEVLRDKAI
jgi:methionyl aminopeptidase